MKKTLFLASVLVLGLTGCGGPAPSSSTSSTSSTTAEIPSQPVVIEGSVGQRLQGPNGIEFILGEVKPATAAEAKMTMDASIATFIKPRFTITNNTAYSTWYVSSSNFTVETASGTKLNTTYVPGSSDAELNQFGLGYDLQKGAPTNGSAIFMVEAGSTPKVFVFKTSYGKVNGAGAGTVTFRVNL